jgi:LacI family transcriptional regulator, repressor for deo operon, udp, cdd, tsx, nupC, and nupG
MSMTAAELGKIVGVSTATISRALNNTGAVSSKTREAIFKALQETRYVPRRQGKERRAAVVRTDVGNVVEIVFHRHSPVEQLALGDRDFSLGPLLPMPAGGLQSESYHFAVSFHRQIIDGAIAELARWNYRAVVQFNADLLESKFIADMNRPDKRGVLMIGEPSEKFPQFVDRCRHPLVLADFRADGPYEIVTSDSHDGVYQAFDHLYKLGHRKIGYVGNQHDLIERYMAFHAKMASAGLSVNPKWMYEGGPHIGPTARGVAQLLSTGDRPTALVCGNDCYAIGVLRAASSLGVSVPNDLSVVGFDDIDASALITPSLTTVRVPQMQIGQQAARQLMIAVQTGTPATRGCVVRLKTELVERGSTGPAPV